MKLNCRYDGPSWTAEQEHLQLIREVCPHLEEV